MRILVTGGAGFQGSHLVESLLKQGHQVTILNTPSERAKSNIASFADQVQLVWGTITDKELVQKTVRDHETVFHLAAYINVDQSRVDPTQIIHTNTMGTVNILEAVRECQNRLIYGSSCEVYGDGHSDDNDADLSETAELRPNSPYAASKAAADRLCHAYHRTFGVKVTIARPFNIFGERQKSGSFGALIPILVSRAMKGKDLVVFGSGQQSRDYMHVDDVISAYNLLLNRPELAGKAINFGTGNPVPIITIAEHIARRFGVKIVHQPSRPGEVAKFGANIARARSLGWEPKVNFWMGLAHYIAWAEKNGC